LRIDADRGSQGLGNVRKIKRRSDAWTPIDQVVGSEIYVEFYKKVTGRDSAQIKAIWSRILFTGRGVPPK
jgi:hypothetical protein